MTVLAVALALAGCPGAPPPVQPPKPSVRPAGRSAEPIAARAVPADALAKAVAGATTRAVAGGVATRLTGKAKVLAELPAGVLGNNSGRLVSNNGGTIISDNGAGVIANNGGSVTTGGSNGTLIANNGGGYRLHQAGEVAELPLGDAIVTVHDAAGKLLTDAKGAPLAAFTDRQGNYALEAALPAENVVLKIRLWNGGELAAMRPKDGGAEQPIDTATALGAAYVLQTYVKGDQKTFDKLPAAEADGLRQAIEAGRGQLAGLPTYKPDDLLARAGGLREKVAAVDARLDAIAALLIGQANTGDGRLATEVAIATPRAMAVDARGHLFLGDSRLGRVREVDAAGRITTFADVLLGTRVKRNVLDLTCLVPTPDGGFWIANDGQTFEVLPDGQLGALTALKDPVPGPIDGPMGAQGLRLRQAVFAPDGTAYAWDASGNLGESRLDRLLAIAPDRRVTDLPIPAALAGRAIEGIGRDAAGRLYTLASAALEEIRLLRREPDGTWKLHATWPFDHRGVRPSLVVGADGTAFVTDPNANRVMRVAPAGEVGVAAGAGGPEPTRTLDQPGQIALAPDGTLYVADGGSGRVFALGAGGSWQPAAGATGYVTRTGDLTAIALNGPHSVAADEAGFVFTEGQGFAVKRFDGQAVLGVAGLARGFAGDGGPAAAARLNGPTGIVRRDGTTWVLDAMNNALRKIGPDGTITTVAGRAIANGQAPAAIAAGGRYPAGAVDIWDAQSLALDPQGRPYWALPLQGRIMRLDADGMVALVAGKGTSQKTLQLDATQALADVADSWPAAEAPLLTPLGLAFDAQGALYVAEAMALRVTKIADPGGAAPTVRRFLGARAADVVGRAAAGEPMDYRAELAKPPLETALLAPVGLAFDARGALYISLAGSRPVSALPAEASIGLSALPAVAPGVLRMAPDGGLRMVAGPAGTYFADPGAEDALALPGGIAIDAQGRLAICDTGANLLRILPPSATAP